MGNKIEKKKRKNEIELDNIQNELNLLTYEEINKRIKYYKEFIINNLCISDSFINELLKKEVISINQFNAYNLILTELKLEKDKLNFDSEKCIESLILLNNRNAEALLDIIIESSYISAGKEFLQLLLSERYITLHVVKCIISMK